MKRLTERQRQTLEYVRDCGPVGSGHDGTQLRALAKQGLVNQHHFSQGQNTYYTWTITETGRERLKEPEVTVRVSPTMANEYAARCVWENEGWAGFPDQPGTHHVSMATATQMYDDAEYNGDAKDGPEYDPGERAAYRAMARQLKPIVVKKEQSK